MYFSLHIPELLSSLLWWETGICSCLFPALTTCNHNLLSLSLILHLSLLPTNRLLSSTQTNRTGLLLSSSHRASKIQTKQQPFTWHPELLSITPLCIPDTSGPQRSEVVVSALISLPEEEEELFSAKGTVSASARGFCFSHSLCSTERESPVVDESI